jgi:anti-sigma B factor antagonist
LSQPDREAHLISISRIRQLNGTEISVLKLRGSIREDTELDFRARLLEGGRRSPHFLLDLSELEYVSASGLAILLEQGRTQERRGGWFRLVAPSPSVAMILRLSGVTATLPIWEDEEKALADLSSRAA